MGVDVLCKNIFESTDHFIVAGLSNRKCRFVLSTILILLEHKDGALFVVCVLSCWCYIVNEAVVR